MYGNKSSERGFIALLSVIIVSAILLVVVLEANTSGFYTRFNILDSEFKERSSSLVDACVAIARMRVGANSSYIGPETVSVGSDQCQIVGTLNGAGNPRVFQIQAIYQTSYTDAQVSIDTDDLSIVSWKEVPHW